MITEDSKCPNCGCQILDPFGWGEITHDTDECFAAIKPAVGTKGAVTGMREGNRPLSEEGGSRLLQITMADPAPRSTLDMAANGEPK